MLDSAKNVWYNWAVLRRKGKEESRKAPRKAPPNG